MCDFNAGPLRSLQLSLCLHGQVCRLRSHGYARPDRPCRDAYPSILWSVREPLGDFFTRKVSCSGLVENQPYLGRMDLVRSLEGVDASCKRC